MKISNKSGKNNTQRFELKNYSLEELKNFRKEDLNPISSSIEKKNKDNEEKRNLYTTLEKKVEEYTQEMPKIIEQLKKL